MKFDMNSSVALFSTNFLRRKLHWQEPLKDVIVDPRVIVTRPWEGLETGNSGFRITSKASGFT